MSSRGQKGILENIWSMRGWMIIHSREASPCFNKTNCPRVFWWQAMITHDPESEWVKITENWWKSRAGGQMALKRRICDYYFLSLQSDRAWIYLLWKIYRAVDTTSTWKWLYLFLANGERLTPRHGCRNQPTEEDAFPRRRLTGFAAL